MNRAYTLTQHTHIYTQASIFYPTTKSRTSSTQRNAIRLLIEPSPHYSPNPLNRTLTCIYETTITIIVSGLALAIMYTYATVQSVHDGYGRFRPNDVQTYTHAGHYMYTSTLNRTFG